MGILDTNTNNFYTISTAVAGVTADNKYVGTVAVGTRVFFAPYNEDSVGVFDVISDTFSTISTVAAGVTGDRKYAGAASVGTRIFFAPTNEDNVGILDLAPWISP